MYDYTYEMYLCGRLWKRDQPRFAIRKLENMLMDCILLPLVGMLDV